MFRAGGPQSLEKITWGRECCGVHVHMHVCLRGTLVYVCTNTCAPTCAACGRRRTVQAEPRGAGDRGSGNLACQCGSQAGEEELLLVEQILYLASCACEHLGVF